MLYYFPQVTFNQSVSLYLKFILFRWHTVRFCLGFCLMHSHSLFLLIGVYRSLTFAIQQLMWLDLSLPFSPLCSICPICFLIFLLAVSLFQFSWLLLAYLNFPDDRFLIYLFSFWLSLYFFRSSSRN